MATGISADGLTIVGYGEKYDSFTDESYTEAWLATIPVSLRGDFDADGDVDGVDFGLWQSGYPTASGASLVDGDDDGDGDVDGVDFGLWQANYPGAVPAPVAGATAVPEPATLGLLLIGALVLLRRRESS